MKKLRELQNLDIRMVAVYYPAVTTLGGQSFDESNEFHQAFLDGDLDKELPHAAKYRKEYCGDVGELDYESLAQYFVGMPLDLMVAYFETPVREKVGKYTSYSWGYRTGRWFAGNSLDELCDKAIKHFEKLNKKKAA